MKFTLALITGATSGIGASLAHLLSDKGINLILTGRDQQQLNNLETLLSKKVSVTTLSANLENKNNRAPLIDAIRQKAPDLIINNAGFGSYGLAIEQSIDNQLKMAEVNANAVLEITIEGAKALKTHNKRGVVVNIASFLAFLPSPGMAVYGASKTFVLNFSKALDYELYPFGIRVLTSCPGQVETSFVKRATGNENTERRGPVMKSQYVAEKIWHQILSEKRVDIVDWTYKILFFITRILPEEWVNKMLLKSSLARIS